MLERSGAYPSAYRIPFGGSSPESARAYLEAAGEIIDDVPDLRHVVVAVGSGGTMAGLVAGLGAERVLGVGCGAVTDARATVSGLLEGMGEALEPGALRLDEKQVGEGYEHVTAATREAMTLAAQTEGLILDPTYTGRAMAGLVAAVRDADIRPGERTVFLHSGGLPGLFGHPEL